MKKYTAAEFICNKPNLTPVEKRIQERCAWFDNIIRERLKK